MKQKKHAKLTIDKDYKLVEKSRKLNKEIEAQERRWASHLGITLESFRVIQKMCHHIKQDDTDPALRRDLITSYVVGFVKNYVDPIEAIKFLGVTTTLDNFQIVEYVAEIETWETLRANNNRSSDR